jgi:hypothetical protein
VLLFITSTSSTSAVSSNASVPPPKTFLAIFTFSSNYSCRNVNSLFNKVLHTYLRIKKNQNAIFGYLRDTFFMLPAFRTQFFTVILISSGTFWHISTMKIVLCAIVREIEFGSRCLDNGRKSKSHFYIYLLSQLQYIYLHIFGVILQNLDWLQLKFDFVSGTATISFK